MVDVPAAVSSALLPIDAAQHLIMGSGEALEATVSDPTVASVSLGDTMDDRSVTIIAAQATRLKVVVDHRAEAVVRRS